jgi:ABC-type uncharacterized transport system involved in gliding motility auxiliary subunit
MARRQSSAPQRFLISLNFLVQVFFAFLIFVLVNGMVFRWQLPRIDLGRTAYFQLSDKTLQLLKSVKEPIEVMVFFQPGSNDPTISQVYEDIKWLLKEYEAVNPKLIRVKYADPDRDPITADRLLQLYHVKEANVVGFILEKEGVPPRFKFVSVGELVEYEQSTPFSQSNRIKFFKGEQQFSSAIQSILEEAPRKVYFLQGHGEADPDNLDPKGGYSEIASYIRQDNLVLEKLNLLESNKVPGDCEVLVICSPGKPFSEQELNILRDYLRGHGRLLVMLDAMKTGTGLEKWLKEYQVKVGDDIVLVKVQDRLGGEALFQAAPGQKYGDHPITESLRRENLNTLFQMARTVDVLVTSPQEGPREQVTILVQTHEATWAETNLDELKRNLAALDDADRKGPVPLAVAVEPSNAGGMEREGMRMVVYGSSSFVGNGNMKGGNVDLFMNSLNWLVKRQHLIGIAPKTPREFSLTLDAFQLRSIVFSQVIVIPGAIAVLGFLVWMRRRK